MNIHISQTHEALHLIGLRENIIAPKSGEPIVALIQDFLTSAFLLQQTYLMTMYNVY